MNKIYAHDAYLTKDKNLFKELDRERNFCEKGEMVIALLLHKSTCDYVRNGLRVNCLIGFYLITDEETKEVMVLVNLYDAEGAQDNYILQHYDKEKNEFYIESATQRK